MNLSPRTIGGAFQKAGIHIEQGSKLIKTKINAKANNLGVDETIEQVQKLGQETKERLGAVDQAIENSSKIKNAYKEATRGTDSAASEAINRTSEPKASNSKANQIRFTNQDGTVVERNINTDYNPNSPKGESNNRYNYIIDGQEASLGEFKNMAAAHVQSGGTFDTLSEQAAQVAEQTSKTGVLERSGIPEMMMNHPFASAGIAGGAGILGASLFGGEGDDDGYN